MRLELPQYHTADESLRQVYAYLTRLVDKLNYVLTVIDVPDETSDAGIRGEDPNNKTIKLGEKSTNTQYPSAKAVVDYAVPKTRQINGKTLENDIALTAADVGAVPTSRTINGHVLTEDVELDAADVGAAPEDRTINGHALTADVTLTPADLGEGAYVTETGSSGAWTWRKWSTGDAELWAADLNIALGTATSWTGALVRQDGTAALPIALQNGAQVQAAPSGNDGIVLAATAQSAGVQITVARTAAASSANFNIYVRGIAAEGV